MVSFIAVPCVNIMVFHHQPISYLNSPTCFPVVSVINPPKLLKLKKQNHLLFEFSGFCGVVRMCKNWEGESDPSLEVQVLEFMKKSKNPKRFPAKKELIDAGKFDLVEEIMKKGGWMNVGWEDEDDGEIEVKDEEVMEVCESELNNDLELFFEKNGQNGFEGEELSGPYPNEERHFEGLSSATSSSGRPLEVAAEVEGGIEGILRRLERQRDLNLSYKLGKNGTDFVDGEFGDNDQNKGIRKDVDAWRTWSIQRAGFSDTEFEAGEIDFGKNTEEGIVDKSMGERVAVTAEVSGAQDNTKDLDTYYREITRGDLKTRLQHLEVELSTALHSLRSNTSDLSAKEKKHLSEDLRQLSDVSEFQENEMMNAQDKLRTLRAKLAVLEGKMSLAIMDAQYILNEKQKRINDARKALQLLRTTCIVWPNHGSEVLLAGSFDGWATQRKMTRSSTGIFSLCLKLYPGKYEIKFIVDGVWKVDPLRPIVSNNGFENNLLTIT